MNINVVGDFYINLGCVMFKRRILFVDDKYVACLWAVLEITDSNKTLPISCFHDSSSVYITILFYF